MIAVTRWGNDFKSEDQQARNNNKKTSDTIFYVKAKQIARDLGKGQSPALGLSLGGLPALSSSIFCPGSFNNSPESPKL